MIRHMRWIGLALVALLAAGTVSWADDKGDLKKMAGTWISGGSKEIRDESKWVFEGDRLKVTSPKRNYETTISLDTKDKPHQIDFKINEAPEDAKGKTSLGIYKFDSDDDTLTICISGVPNYRPESFEAEQGKSYLFVLKKQEKDQD